MRFDYTKGKPATHRVSIRDRVVTDSYYFSDYDEARQLYNKVVAERKDEIASVRLADLSKKGTRAILASYTNNDSSKYAYYDFCENIIYIRTDCIVPHGDVDRKTFSEAFEKSIEERLELYPTPEEKASIKEFLSKHKGAKLSEYTIAF